MAIEKELKKLETQKREVHQLISKLERKLAYVKRDIENAKAQLVVLERAEITLTEPEGQKQVIITEHAILRYLERVKGIDIEAVKAELLPDDAKSLVMQFGNGAFPAGTHKVVCKNMRIMTVVENGSKTYVS